MRETYPLEADAAESDVRVATVEPSRVAGLELLPGFARGSTNRSEVSVRRRRMGGAFEQHERLRGLVRCLLENDPNELLIGNVRIIDMWRNEAREILETD
jgi:hypothetical protein